MSTPERRASWKARIMEYCAAKKKLQKRGKPLEAIEAKITALLSNSVST